MKPIFPTPLLSLCLVALLSLSACQTAPPARGPQAPGPVPTAPGAPPGTDIAAAAEQQGQYVLAAREYERLVQSAPVPRRQELQLKVVELLLKAGQIGDARQRLNVIDVQGLAPAFLARKQILQARISLAEGRADHAQRVLNQAEKQQALEPALSAEIYRVRAQVELALGNSLKATQALVVRERYLGSETEIEENHKQLWSVLSAQGRSGLQKDRPAATDPVLAGWIDLALIAVNYPPDSMALAVALDDWKRTHPGHPGLRTIFASLASAAPGLIGPIQRIALLLPLSSDRAQAAQAVRDGFLAMDAANRNPDKPRVQVIDIGPDASQASAFYAAAVAGGAQLVVGPLGLEAAEQVARANAFTVPTLLLSHVESEINSEKPVFQFGLPPEQEASQAAERAYLDGHRRAAVLHPATPWGQRMLNAFVTHWQLLGGTVVVSQAFTPGGTDYSQSVKDLLGVTASEARAQALQNRLRGRIRFEPRPREDIDLVFLAADTKHGRLIKPQLNYFRASQIPVYSTSYIYGGTTDAVHDVDLDGVMFGDMPWMLVAGGRMADLRAKLQPDWPYAHTPVDRLFAFGIDAYGVIPYLNRMQADHALRYKGVTSSLGLEPDGRLHRQLMWARFQRGIPQPLDTNIQYGSAPLPDPNGSRISEGMGPQHASSAGAAS